MKSLESIYTLCPQLRDIAMRLDDSEKEVSKQNTDRKNKNSDARTLYPEHCRITKIYINNRWEDTAFKAKPGKEEFESALETVVNSRNPHALKIEIYNGKRTTSNFDSFTCYLAENAEIISEITNKGMAGPHELEIVKKNPGRSEGASGFELQILELRHEQTITNLKNDHQREIDLKNRIIEDLEEEIEELEEKIDTQDAELGSAADMIKQKVEPKPLHVMLAAVAEEALENFILHRPKILKEAFKLDDDQIKKIFTREQKQITAPAQENTSGAEFSEAPNNNNEFEGVDPEQVEAIKQIILLLKAIPKKDFPLIYNVFAFCATPEGDLHIDHTNTLLKVLMPIAEQEKNA